MGLSRYLAKLGALIGSDGKVPASAVTGLGSAALVNTTAFDAAGAATTAQAASLQKSSNLSDLGSAATARSNLGLGTAATANTTAFDAAGAASTAQAACLQKSSNLSDLGSAATARSNLGLAAVAASGAYSDLSGKPTLFSGSAADLSGVLAKARLPAGTVLQAQSIFFSTIVSNTTRSFVNISGFAATITPISANSKILILGQVSGSASAQGSYEIGYRVTRNGTSVGQNTNGSSYTAMSSSGYAAEAPTTVPLVYVDSPGSTSALTYQVQWMAGEGVTYYLNAPTSNNSIDSQSYFTAGASSLILLEIAG